MPRLRHGIWVLPTLGRPQGLSRIAQDIRWSDPEARIAAVFSKDDQAGYVYPSEWETIIMEGTPTVVEKFNEAFARFPNEQFYGFLSDDLKIKTRRALGKLAKHCPPWGLSYGRDGIYDEKIACFPCVSGDLIRALGWLAYPKAKHHFIDVYLHRLAREFGGLKYMEGIVFQHNHYTKKTAPMDATYELGKSCYDHDSKVYCEWGMGEGQTVLDQAKESQSAVTT